MKKQNRNKKIVALIAIILVIIILTIIITTNVIKNNNINNEKYLATANANSELVASYIKSGVTIGGITGTLEVLDTSDATATPEDILLEKTAYVNGEKITGTLEKKSNVIDLGIGRTFDLKNYSNYQEFTTENFFCEPINKSVPYSAGIMGSTRRYNGGIDFSKSYNPETGILSATAYSIVYYVNSSNQIEGTYGSQAYNVHAYLVY